MSGFSPIVGQVPGTATNDSANAGNVGEFISATSSSGAGVSLTSAATANVLSISLTAGDWDVQALLGIYGGSTTTLTAIQTSISTTSATIDTTSGRVDTVFLAGQTPFGSINQVTRAFPRTRISLNTTTTVYLTVNVVFGVSTCGSFGTLTARRVR